jgi:acetyl esterase
LVAGSVATHDSIARALANSGGCRVVSVEYRLAPEHPFPAALDDALAASRYSARTPRNSASTPHGSALRRLGRRHARGGDLPGHDAPAAPRSALQLLICPDSRLQPLDESRRELGSGYLVDQATLDHDLLHYAPPAPTRPIRGSRRCAPRTSRACREP